MRFDLTVNEFTRDLWADRRLEVFGEQFWRPYVHVRDAARGVAHGARGAGRGGRRRGLQRRATPTENYRKLDLVELIRRETERGEVAFVHRTEDPRDYKVSFDKVADQLGYGITIDGPRRDPRDHRRRSSEERFEDAFDGRYRNIA